jgi:hypothetical protein
MSNKIAIHKIAGSLTPKERAKMMVLDLDEKYRTGKGTLTKVDKDQLRTLDTSREREEYGFYYDIQMIWLPMFSSEVESSVLRFVIGYCVLQKAVDAKDNERIGFARRAMQDNFNRVHSYLEAANCIENKYDFPVLGGYHKGEIENNLEILSHFTELASDVFYTYQKTLKQNGGEQSELSYLEPPEIDNEIIEGALEAVGEMAKGIVS